jgi:phage I-like protein
MATVVIENFQKHGADIPIDYEHTSALDPGEKGIKAIAAGWIKKLSWVPNEGLYGDVEWTTQGKIEVESKQYKYISPVIIHDKKTHAIEKLHSVALTNKPRTINQRELLAASLGVSLDSGEKEKVMDLKALKAQLIAAGVKLADDATDEVILAAATEHIGKLKSVSESAATTEAVAASVRVKLGLAKDADGVAIAAKLDSLRADTVPASEYKAVADRLEKIEQTAKARESQELVATAIETAKLNPNNSEQMAWAREYASTDTIGFKKWSDAAPALYPVGRVVTPSKKLDGGNGGRESVIAMACSEYDDSPQSLKALTGREAFVNDALIEGKFSPLTKGELK